VGSSHLFLIFLLGAFHESFFGIEKLNRLIIRLGMLILKPVVYAPPLAGVTRL